MTIIIDDDSLFLFKKLLGRLYLYVSQVVLSDNLSLKEFLEHKYMESAIK